MMNARSLLTIVLVSLTIMISSAGISNADITILGKGHAPIYVSDKSADDYDLNSDALVDYYFRAHYAQVIPTKSTRLITNSLMNA